MIAYWPAVIAPGRTTDHISAFWDLLPTLTEVAGAPIPDDTDGLSFAPTLRGQSGSQAQHEFLYWEFPSYGGQQAVRLGKWKGVRQNMLEGNLDVALYDLEGDPLEENDVAADNPEIVAQIETILKQEHVPSEIERFQFEVLGEK